jgi:hypothetical protein
VPATSAPQQFDVFLNTNSNDSLSNDQPSSSNRINITKIRQPSRSKDGSATTKAKEAEEDCAKTNEITTNNESMPSTSSRAIASIFFNNCKYSDQSTSTSNFTEANVDPIENNAMQHDQEHLDDQLPDAGLLGTVDDDENWEDCEEGSEEEICTCHDYLDDEGVSSEDELLPSRDVDLSSYTHLDSISDDILHDPNSCNAQTPRIHRKRKLTENRLLRGDSPSTESINFSSRKRLALDSTSSPRASLLSPSSLLNVSSFLPFFKISHLHNAYFSFFRSLLRQRHRVWWRERHPGH